VTEYLDLDDLLAIGQAAVSPNVVVGDHGSLEYAPQKPMRRCSAT